MNNPKWVKVFAVGDEWHVCEATYDNWAMRGNPVEMTTTIHPDLWAALDQHGEIFMRALREREGFEVVAMKDGKRPALAFARPEQTVNQWCGPY